MGDRFFSELNACLPISFDNVASNIWVALASLDDKAIVATWRDVILPNFGCAELGPICARYLDAVLVWTLDFILDYVRLVVVHFDTDLIQIKLVSYNLITVKSTRLVRLTAWKIDSIFTKSIEWHSFTLYLH